MNKIKKIFIILILFIILTRIIKKNCNLNFINIKNQLNIKNIKYKINNKKKIKFDIFKKKYKIIFFGYTLCTDICPRVIENIKKTIINIKNAYKIIFIFFSINWENENNELTQKYINKLCIKNFYGLNETGKKTELICKSFRIIYKYSKKKINHSNIIYIMNKKNQIIFLDINKKKKNFFKFIKN